VVYLEGRREPGPFAGEDRENAEVFASNIAPLAERILMRRRIADESDATGELRERYALDHVVGRSPALAAALRQAMLAAPLDVTVLLTGPSGTGKTQTAQVIHQNSSRSGGPFVEINCASLPETLLESELFGAKAGSHSEAKRDRPGKVAAAEGGTLFLDEVGELPPQAQAKLLQILHSKQYYALGSTRAIRADIRLIAASNTDLERLVEEKRFREDLYYRLNVLPVRLPTLSERCDDLRELAQTLCQRAAQRHSLPLCALSPAAVRAVEAAEWPGNVRQLENSLEAAVIRAAGEGASELATHHIFPDAAAPESGEEAPPTYQAATRRFQRDLLARTLEDTGWNVSETARRLDLARSYVYELIRAFELERGSGGAGNGGSAGT
jgi:Nif-specific regulatory protein